MVGDRWRGIMLVLGGGHKYRNLDGTERRQLKGSWESRKVVSSHPPDQAKPLPHKPLQSISYYLHTHILYTNFLTTLWWVILLGYCSSVPPNCVPCDFHLVHLIFHSLGFNASVIVPGNLPKTCRLDKVTFWAWLPLV